MTPVQNTYLDDQVAGSSPVRLVAILYEVALRNVANARLQLQRGDVKGRSESITKASNALIELSSSLNHQAGGELSRNMTELYSFLHSQLLSANFDQCDVKLAEVEQILNTMADPWISGEVERRLQPMPPPMNHLDEAAAGAASRSWVL